jgi:hypothetical protein
VVCILFLALLTVLSHCPRAQTAQKIVLVLVLEGFCTDSLALVTDLILKNAMPGPSRRGLSDFAAKRLNRTARARGWRCFQGASATLSCEHASRPTQTVPYMDGCFLKAFQPRKLLGLTTFIWCLRDKTRSGTCPRFRRHTALRNEHDDEYEKRLRLPPEPRQKVRTNREKCSDEDRNRAVGCSG